ncbi:hypothetical protein GF327_04975 [Candidatus Woesearchaeota archaeon]|nr:hypothetical protein [Candidatus Woesearchaeota archaeon]
MVEKKDEDTSLDFSRVKDVFNKRKKKNKQREKQDDEIEINTDKIFVLIKKYGAFLIVLIPLIINIYFRLHPHYLPITDDFARQSVYNSIRNDITNQINQQYPNLPPENKKAMVDERFNQVLAQQGNDIEKAIKQNSEYLRSKFKDDNGYTYLGDIDSYYYMRHARNIVEKGHPGDIVEDGKQVSTYMEAPKGAVIAKNLYSYIEAYLYRFLKIFQPKMTYMQAAFLTPLLLSTVAILAAFLVGKKLAGNIGGFFTSMIIAVHPTILSRSLGSDNDIVNAFFPLIILAFFFWSISSKNKKNAYIFAVLSGFSLGFYSFAWSGWWYLFYFLTASLLSYIGYRFAYHLLHSKKRITSFYDKEIRNVLILLILFTTLTSITAIALGNYRAVKGVITLKNVIVITRLRAASKGANLWPNVYTTVAELNPASLGETINGVGSKLLFVIALMGIISTLVDFKKQKLINLIYFGVSFVWFVVIINNTSMNLLLFLFLLFIPILAGIIISLIYKYDIDVKYSILLVFWFMATIYAASKGIRFILLLIPPFAIAFSIAVSLLYEFLVKFSSKHLYISKNIAKIIVLLLLLTTLVNPIKAGQNVSKRYIPHVNDGWYASLTKIKDESAKDAIVNSWWDFGHWFKFLADRRVTFDGASQNSPMAHWVGKALLTAKEEEAVGILRMLDCGSNDAFKVINEETNDTILSIEIINEIIVMDKEEAQEYLEDYFSEKKTEEILSLSHCKAPENYFITSEDMVGKSGVWAHFGIWSFERAKLYYYFDSKSKPEFVETVIDEFDYSEKEANNMYNTLLNLRTDRQVNDWIASWPSYGGRTGCSKNGNTSLVCGLPAGNGQKIPVEIDLEDKNAEVKTQDNKVLHPKKFGFMDEGEFVEKTYENDVLPNDISFVLVNTGGNYRMVLMAPELVGSTFTRLFYLEGEGMDHFEKFSDVRDVQGQRIIVWKVKW